MESCSEKEYEEEAIKALGSLFNLTQVFLRDDHCYASSRDTLPESLHDETLSDSTLENNDDMDLLGQMNALGLPISFRTSKITRSGMVKCKIKGMNQKHLYGHEETENIIDLTTTSDHNIAILTEKVGLTSGKEEGSEHLASSAACAAIEKPDSEGLPRVTSDYGLNSEAALRSESSEVLDHDKSDTQVFGGSEVWASYWDSYYSRYYFYNTFTNESTWDPPPGMEHLAFGEVIDKPNEVIGVIVENLGSQCSIESIDSLREFKEDDHLMDQISSEPCLNFEVSDENFHTSTSMSTLNHSSENLTEAQGIQKSCLEDSSLSLLEEYVDSYSGEIKKLEENGVSEISQSPTDGLMHKEETEGDRVIIKQKKKARKRIRLNTKSSVGSGELQLEGILEEGISEGKCMLEELSPSISKYWCQRYRLFSRYDNGIKMDEEGWFSATPEPIAKHHAIRCGKGVIIDCFTGVGGNAIQFARRGRHVVAIDIDPKKIEYAQHNAAIYGVSDRIDFVIGDTFLLAPRLKADTVFLSPPWGGPNYLKEASYDINKMLKPHGGDFLFNVAKGIASKVVMFLPRTVDLNQLAELALSAKPPWSLEVEKNFLNGKLKAITAYFTAESL